MDWKPMHDIQLDHRWKKAEKVESNGGGVINIERCEDCGEERHYLDLDANPDRGPSLRDLAQDESLREACQDELKKLVEATNELGDWARRMIRDLLANTEYDNIEDLIKDIEKRYPSRVRAGEMPVDDLRDWIDKRNKAFKRKVLLAQKQGPVCNRCDAIVFSWDELTVDHIRPKARGGGEELANLQLLCGRCNEDKGDNRPDKRDTSPFSNYGQQCLHRITCVKLGELRRSYKENKRKKGSKVS